LVAKVYKRPLGPAHAEKISTMVRLRSERLLRLAAWPVDTLHDHANGAVAGFLMPKATGFKPAVALYSPKSRLAEFPGAGWPFLVHAAANAARAFAVIHEHGHVVADVNHGNLLVSDQATAKFIDCDSFQISDPKGRLYRCEVGVSTHTPPELQGRRFHDVDRTPNHDAFGLAVLIFQFLFMGRHPFSGTYAGAGEMGLEKAIGEFRFAYGPAAGSRGMAQPPGSLPLDGVSPSVAALFERAFGAAGVRDGRRPTAQEWVGALGGLAQALRPCSRNVAHHFFAPMVVCPWCAIEARAGTLLFNIVTVGTSQSHATFDLSAVWAQITAVPSPGPSPLPTLLSASVQPSPAALAAHGERRKRQAIGIGLAAVVVVIAFLAVPQGAAVFWLIVGGLVAGVMVARTGAKTARQEAEAALREARAAKEAVEQRWRKETGPTAFETKLRELEAKKTRYQDLPSVRQRKLAVLHADREKHQRQRFLDSHRIAYARIGGIGPSRLAALQSYGIETAADVGEAAVLAVPGFGPAYTQKLLDWRRDVERRFVFDAARGIDQSDVAAIEREIASARQQLERDLRDGSAVLRDIGQQAVFWRQTLRPSVERALHAVAQAEVDVKTI
jgi:DNA-binding helix-hairpin-helix protein with protein kinase domain